MRGVELSHGLRAVGYLCRSAYEEPPQCRRKGREWGAVGAPGGEAQGHPAVWRWRRSSGSLLKFLSIIFPPSFALFLLRPLACHRQRLPSSSAQARATRGSQTRSPSACFRSDALFCSVVLQPLLRPPELSLSSSSQEQTAPAGLGPWSPCGRRLGSGRRRRHHVERHAHHRTQLVAVPEAGCGSGDLWQELWKRETEAEG